MVKRAAAAGPVEGPWALPDGWRWERICDVVSYLSRGRAPSYVDEGGTRIINQKCVRWGGLDQRWSKRTSQASADKLSPDQFIRQSDILWNSTGTGTIGRASLVNARDLDEPTVVDTHVTILRPAGIVPHWLHYWLQVPFVQNAIAGIGSTNQVELSRTTALAMPVPFPDLEVQRRIVARIDELLAEIDDGEAALARAREGLATWRKALLKAAVTGELTADWRDANPPAETGADLRDCIIANRTQVAAKRLGKRRDKAPEEITSAQRDLMWPAPEGGTWLQLGDFSFVTKLAGFEYTKFVQYDAQGDLRVIKAENAGLNGFKATNYSRVRSEAVSELTRSRLRGGELLMVFVGAGTGNVAMVPEGEDFFLGPNIGMMRVETEFVSPRYVEFFLRSPTGKALATAAMKAVAQPSLSMGTIRQVPILLPPPAEQNEIVRRLEEALAETTSCDLELREHQASVATLRQSILAAAFRGELA